MLELQGLQQLAAVFVQFEDFDIRLLDLAALQEPIENRYADVEADLRVVEPPVAVAEVFECIGLALEVIAAKQAYRGIIAGPIDLGVQVVQIDLSVQDEEVGFILEIGRTAVGHGQGGGICDERVAEGDGLVLWHGHRKFQGLYRLFVLQVEVLELGL